MLSWIHRSLNKCMLSPCTRERNLLWHPGPSLSESAPLAAGSAGSESRRRRQPRFTAAACRCRAQISSPRPTQRRHPMIRRKYGLRQATEAGGNLSYPSLSSRAMYSLTNSLANLSSSLFLASVVSQWSARRPRLKSNLHKPCQLPGRGFKRN